MMLFEIEREVLCSDSLYRQVFQPHHFRATTQAFPQRELQLTLKRFILGSFRNRWNSVKLIIGEHQ